MGFIHQLETHNLGESSCTKAGRALQKCKVQPAFAGALGSNGTETDWVSNVISLVRWGIDIAQQSQEVKTVYDDVRKNQDISDRYKNMKPVLTKGTIKNRTNFCRNPTWLCNKQFRTYPGEKMSVLASSPGWVFVEDRKGLVGYVKRQDINISTVPLATGTEMFIDDNWNKIQAELDAQSEAYAANELNNRCYELFPGFNNETGKCLELAAKGQEYQGETNQTGLPAGALIAGAAALYLLSQ